MNHAQLNAINYSVAKRNKERAEREAEVLSVDKLFKYQTQCKTVTAFVRNVKKGTLNTNKITQTLNKRRQDLINSKAPSWHFEELKEAAEQLEQLKQKK